jgi:hypothetical protein
MTVNRVATSYGAVAFEAGQLAILYINSRIPDLCQQGNRERLGHVREINWAYVDGSKYGTDNGPYTLARVGAYSHTG